MTEVFRIVGSACMDVLDPFPEAGTRHISTQNVTHMVFYEQCIDTQCGDAHVIDA